METYVVVENSVNYLSSGYLVCYSILGALLFGWFFYWLSCQFAWMLFGLCVPLWIGYMADYLFVNHQYYFPLFQMVITMVALVLYIMTCPNWLMKLFK